MCSLGQRLLPHGGLIGTLGDRRAHQRTFALRLRFLRQTTASLLGGLEPGHLREGVLAQAHHQEFRRERLLGVPCRALRLAASALGAGGEVEQALPGEILDLAGAQGSVLIEILKFLEVQGLAADIDRIEFTEGHGAVSVPLEPDVRPRGEAVPRHTHCEVEGDHAEPSHRDEDLDCRHPDDRGLQGLDRSVRREEGGERKVEGCGALGALGPEETEFKPSQCKHTDADGEDRELHIQGHPGT